MLDCISNQKHFHKLAIFIFSCVLLFSHTVYAETITHYNIDFSSPTHTDGSSPSIGSSPEYISEIIFGAPQIKSSFGSFDQSLVFNQKTETYEQIGLNIDPNWGNYRIEFDIETDAFAGSSSYFSFHLHQFHFNISGAGVVSGPSMNWTDITYESKLHIIMFVSFEHNYLTLKVGDSALRTIAFSPMHFEYLTLKFNLSTAFYATAVDPDVFVAIDNVTVTSEDQDVHYLADLDSYIKSGDINFDNKVDEHDLVESLQISAGQKADNKYFFLQSDVNGDNQIGLEETLFALQKLRKIYIEQTPIINSISSYPVSELTFNNPDETLILPVSISFSDKDRDVEFIKFQSDDGLDVSYPVASMGFKTDGRTEHNLRISDNSSDSYTYYAWLEDSKGHKSEVVEKTVRIKRKYIPTEENYFPLAKGNRWNYDNPNIRGGGAIYEVGDKVSAQGDTYAFEYSNWGYEPLLYSSDIYGWRIHGGKFPFVGMPSKKFISPLVILPTQFEIDKTIYSGSSVWSGTIHYWLWAETTVLGVEDVQESRLLFKDCYRVKVTVGVNVQNNSQFRLDEYSETTEYFLCKGIGIVKIIKGEDVWVLTSTTIDNVFTRY